ncbi:MAG TPA: basic secretory protein-like protein [Urbifossiella sp.]|nr:basic secretory protein-like protein [Urbifossiella sp.]
MRRLSFLAVTLASAPLVAQPAAPAPRPVVRAVAESSLPTAGGRIRQFAFDGDPNTSFTSEGNATKDDHFTLTFDKSVTLRYLSVLAGRPGEEPAQVVVEVSVDGKTFAPVSPAATMPARAVRVRPIADTTGPLVVREITIRSDPQVVPFRHPIEFVLDVTDAPEMKAWGEKVVRVCEREYPDICTFLASDGYTPPTQLRMTLNSAYGGVAEAGGGRITGSVKYFKSRPDDIGAMVHETVHCVQQYKGRGNPGWLVEGIADYVRFWRYEPGKAGRLIPEKAQYNASYRTTAAFLAYVTDRYDRQAVPKLNAMCREGRYTPAAWRTLTGKDVEELNQEWRQSLAR